MKASKCSWGNRELWITRRGFCLLFWRGLLKLSAGMGYKLQTMKTEFRFQKIDSALAQKCCWDPQGTYYCNPKRNHQLNISPKMQILQHAQIYPNPTGLSRVSWMQAFLAQCRANLASYGSHIAEEVHRSTETKQAGTQESRANHFLEWTKN